MGLEARMEALKAAFAAALATRVVTRSLMNFDQRKKADIEKGVLTLIAVREKDFEHTLDTLASAGGLEILLVGQLKVDDKTEPVAAEAAEFNFAEEVKAVLSSDPSFTVTDFEPPRYSGQLEHPYGWFSMLVTVL